ncbi:MAG: HRDC domain-containing protein [Candidatus Aenigmarchaeota archaeon]|nr:HRDC domain-containing protein [Candidatus Aenigmarchaeota archaeon]
MIMHGGSRKALVLVDTPGKLDEARKEWEHSKEFAVDTESENNMHHYGTYVSLIQLSDGRKNWIVDAIRLKDVGPVIRLLEDPSRQKVFHDPDFDIRILRYQYMCSPRNIFDTQFAAILTGRKEIGLGPLLMEYFGAEKQKKYQKADWTKRPLTREMLEYAAGDVDHLLELRDLLKAELERMGRLHWAEQAFRSLEHADLILRNPTYQEVKGVNKLSPEELSVFKELYKLRENVAKRIDRPVHYVISNTMLKNLSENPPSSDKGWRMLRGVHPFVRRNAGMFMRAVDLARKTSIRIPPKAKKRMNERQKRNIDRLEEDRKAIAEKLGIPAHLILSRNQMTDIAVTGNLSSLMSWQIYLLKNFHMKKKE